MLYKGQIWYFRGPLEILGGLKKQSPYSFFKRFFCIKFNIFWLFTFQVAARVRDEWFVVEVIDFDKKLME